ncbi:hypothetical protein E2C01_032641 [Portunus trituberculatus]|uniref:Uncharacterized protein n=1 Tax=Portunus trituberculatus TaxID=210409 RepID=A0A5B7EVT0_PORTR|nr:hypothetical protein [Portunus trituberculatus]
MYEYNNFALPRHGKQRTVDTGYCHLPTNTRQMLRHSVEETHLFFVSAGVSRGHSNSSILTFPVFKFYCIFLPPPLLLLAEVDE